ncbi:MAG: hypothetical protein AB8H79_07280 [Myxococcota bacterium]
MRSSLTAVLALTAAFAVSGCDEGRKITAGGGVQECSITNQSLNDTQWVMWEAMPEGPNRANPLARMKFFKEDGKLKVDYSVGSPYEMHSYDCFVGEREVNCMEEPKLFDWCLSLEVYEPGSCNTQKLQELAGDLQLEGADIAKAQEEVKAEIALATERFKENPAMMAQYKRSKNFLGNKLQGLLDVNVNEKKCQLRVTDQYMTIFNGKKLVDSNPVGTNPFVQDKDNTYLYENCMEGNKFLALSQEKAPTDEELKAIDPKRQFGSSDTIHYHYIGLKNVEAVEGCSYSADSWVQWKPGAKDMKMEVVDCDYSVPDEADPKKVRKISKCVVWTGAHSWAANVDALKFVGEEPSSPRAFYGLTRYKTCADGKKEELDTICASARVMEE